MNDFITYTIFEETILLPKVYKNASRYLPETFNCIVAIILVRMWGKTMVLVIITTLLQC